MRRFLLIFWICVSWPSLVLGLEVRFSQEALVSGPMLTLGDVAVVKPHSKSASLKDLVLFPAPGPGEQRCYQNTTLKAYICDALSAVGPIVWSGAETICVRQQGSNLLGAEEIQRRINGALRSALGELEAEHLGFELRNPPETVSLPQGELSTEVLFSDPKVLESRQATLVVRVNGQVVDNLTLAGRVRARLPVIVTARNVQRGTILKREHLRIKEQNIAALRDPCLDITVALGKRLKRSVPVNQVLRLHDLERPVVIERRQLVSMILEKGALRVPAKGMAVTEGRVGDLVMVRNMRSKREIPCTVVGPGLTKVEF